jgi:asparagine synthase (glutamine-hydrolysing)
MCGIWFCLGNFCTANVKKYVNNIQKRGPEDTRILSVEHAGTMGFNRLAINGLNPEGMQPMNIENKTYWMCNGEIYNWRSLAKE